MQKKFQKIANMDIKYTDNYITVAKVSSMLMLSRDMLMMSVTKCTLYVHDANH